MKLNKKQKRTATIASMAALLAVVLGMGWQTFAKYISTKEVTAQATVAKWGLVVNTTVQNLFADSYAEVENNGNDDLSVKASKAVVAPGTTGSMTVSVSGMAEVDAELTFKTVGEWKDVTLTDTYTPANGSTTTITYNPVKWTLTEGTTPVVTNGTLEEVKDALDLESQYYDANGEASLDVYTLSWSWAFDKDEDPTIVDEYDTLLGQAAYGNAPASQTFKVVVDENEVDELHTYTYVTTIDFGFNAVLTQVN